MSVASSSKCVFCTFARSARQVPLAGRSFSSTPSQHTQKPKFPSVKAPRANLKKVPVFRDPTYLEQNYTPEQRAAIEAADKVVDNDKIRGRELNRHPWSLTYVDNMTELDPGADHLPKAPWKNIDETSRMKTDEEIDDDLYKFMNNLPDDDEAAVEAWTKFDQNYRLTVGREEAELHPPTALAGRMKETTPEQSTTKKAASTEQGTKDRKLTPEVLQLLKSTGLTLQQLRSIRMRTLLTKRVVNQTRLGKISSRYAITVAGNGNGLIGIGEGKSAEGDQAMAQSRDRAVRNMQPVLRYEGRTTFGDVSGKVSATELELYARPPGFGLRCQGYIYEICRAAGISDIAARVTRSRNPMNTIKATVQALLSQKDPEEIAKARGKKMVDVRKVYYANQV